MTDREFLFGEERLKLALRVGKTEEAGRAFNFSREVASAMP